MGQPSRAVKVHGTAVFKEANPVTSGELLNERKCPHWAGAQQANAGTLLSQSEESGY